MAGVDLKAFQAQQKKKAPQKEKAAESIMNRELSLFPYRLSDKKKEAFYLELSTMLQAGMDLRSVLEMVVEEQKKKKDQAIFAAIQEGLIRGSSFSEALQKSGYFTPYEYYSVQIGEETGQLPVVLQQLSDFFRYKLKQKRQIMNALSYPVLILLSSVGAVGFMLSFIIPMFSDVFKRFGGELPYITKLIISLSNGLTENAGLLALGVAGLIAFFLFLRKQPSFGRFASLLLVKVPVLGSLVKNIYLARFCSSMALLTGAKVPLLNAVALVRQMIDFYPVVSPLEKIEADIMRGNSLHRSLGAFPIFDTKMRALIKVGEEVNQLDVFFDRLASHYTDAVEQQTLTLNTFLEPLMIVFLGLIIGFILIAMYLPMFQLSSGIGA